MSNVFTQQVKVVSRGPGGVLEKSNKNVCHFVRNNVFLVGKFERKKKEKRASLPKQYYLCNRQHFFKLFKIVKTVRTEKY